ncbi:MAG: hypothetical protein WBK77_09375 [Alphaproteobacteria bacterium]
MRKWTQEERARQADLIRQNKPWEKSTGPRTAEGKAQSSKNSLKHGFYNSFWNQFRATLRDHQHYLERIEERTRQKKLILWKRTIMEEAEKAKKINSSETN